MNAFTERPVREYDITHPEFGQRAKTSGQSEGSDGFETTISQTAETFNVTMRTLRFYEEKGLLHPRRVGNRRFYNADCHARLRLILKGKSMGLGLDDIGELVAIVESPLDETARSQKVRALCSAQMERLIERRDELSAQIQETERALDGLTVL